MLDLQLRQLMICLCVDVGSRLGRQLHWRKFAWDDGYVQWRHGGVVFFIVIVFKNVERVVPSVMKSTIVVNNT